MNDLNDGITKVVHRWARAVADGREDAWEELLGEAIADRAAILARARMVSTALAERTCTVDAIVVDGDRVAWRWTLEGTHVGSLLGVPPSGRRVNMTGANFQRIENGRVVEHWTIVDAHAFLRAHDAPRQPRATD